MRNTMAMLLVALAPALGCAMDEASDEAGGSVGGKADGSGVQLASTYALQLTSKMKTEDRRESDPAKRFTELSMLARAQVKVTQSGADVKLAVDICDVVLPMVSGYQPALAPEFVTGLAPLQIEGTIETDGERPELVTSEAALVLGAQLANPLTDALPAAGSSRVRDQDQDGKPGVSISISGWGSIYAALRVKLAFAGGLGDVAAISGAADVALDQKIYGDSIIFYDAAASAAEAEQYVSVVSSSNRVAMKANATTCAKVRQLFP